jgi:hypothetical protein
MKKYQMKDLGYKRTPTSATYVVEMSDGTRWGVPVQIVADSRDEHYAEDGEDTIGFIRNGSLDSFEIEDWAANNMNWSEVVDYAKKMPAKASRVDFEDGWTNGEKEITGDL